MSLLSEQELWALVPNADNLESARAIEAAILAKLEGAELPEPIQRDDTEHGVDYYTALQLQEAYAQGAAAQLAANPIGFCGLSIDGKHIAHFGGKPLFMVGSQGNEIHPTPLYTRREAK